MAFQYGTIWATGVPLNAANLNNCLVGYGNYADFPTPAPYTDVNNPGNAGMQAFAVDLQKLYYSNGTNWVLCGMAADANLVAGNIKSGIAIFGVTGTLVPIITEWTPTAQDSYSTTAGNSKAFRTQTVPSSANKIYAWLAYSRDTGTWTLRIKYQGTTKVEITGMLSGALASIAWNGVVGAGGDVVWETYCEADGQIRGITGGVYIV